MYWVYRYSAHTIDGSELFHAHTAQAIGDAVIAREEKGTRPHVAYTYDNMKGQAFPYVTWSREDSGHWVGSPHRNFDEMRAAVQAHV